jgi:hypothetical protein
MINGLKNHVKMALKLRENIRENYLKVGEIGLE